MKLVTSNDLLNVKIVKVTKAIIMIEVVRQKRMHDYLLYSEIEDHSM